MKKKLITLSIAAIVFIGCSKKNEDFVASNNAVNIFSNMPKFVAKDINIDASNVLVDRNSLSSLNTVSSAVSSVSSRPSRPGGSSSTVNTLRVETDEQVVLDSYQSIVFPGSLIKGESVSNLGFVPIVGYERLPITVSVSIPAINGVVSKEIKTPSLSNTRTAINEILNQSISGDQLSSFTFDLRKFTSYDELKISFGSNIKVGTIFNAAFKDSTSRVSLKTGLIAKFVQRNFTMDMDIPANGRLLAGTISPSSLGAFSPVYVSSITYGRLGIMAIESNYDYNSTYSAFSSAFSFIKAGGSVNLTAEQIKIINESQINIFLRGGQGAEAVRSIRGFDQFVSYIESGGKFSVNSPGIPLFFKLNYLSDHTVFKTIFNVQVSDESNSIIVPPVTPVNGPRPSGGSGRGGRG